MIEIKRFSKLGIIFVLTYLLLTAYLFWYAYNCKTAFCGTSLITAYLPWIAIYKVDVGMTFIGKFLIQYISGLYVSLIFVVVAALLWYFAGLLVQKFLRKIGFMKKLLVLKNNSPVLFWFLMVYVFSVFAFYVLGNYPYTTDGKIESLIASVLMMPVLGILHLIDLSKPTTDSYFSDESFGATYFASAFINFWIYYFLFAKVVGGLERKFSKS